MNKQIKSKAVASGFLFAALFAFAGSSFAGIANSKHDLSVNSTGATVKAAVGGQTEICVFCHTPHGASTTANTPLWNHTMSAAAGFGVYTNTNSMNATATEITGTDGTTSSLCMSCHDGSIAVSSQNNVSNNGLSNAPAAVAGRVTAGGLLDAANSANLGTGATALTNDHPVNFDYTVSVTADGTALGGLTATASLTGVKLFANKVQCASCHDVHDSTNSPFLRVTMTGSALCLRCHQK